MNEDDTTATEVQPRGANGIPICASGRRSLSAAGSSN